MSDYSTQLSWQDAFNLLQSWVPDFAVPTKARDFGFDSAASMMARQPSGLVAFDDGSIPDLEGHFLPCCRERFARQGEEVLVIPDCGDAAQLPIRVTADRLVEFTANYQGCSGNLLGCGADVLFVFDTGDLVLVDHDERVWLAGVVKRF